MTNQIIDKKLIFLTILLLTLILSANYACFERPLATVIIGGLTCTMLFAPFILPPLYWWSNRNENKKNGSSKTHVDSVS